MRDHDFIMWLQGFLAALGEETPMPKDWRTIKAKLAEFTKEPDLSKLIDGNMEIQRPNALNPAAG